MNDFSQPADNVRVKRVSSFAELLATPLRDGINALCWPRSLAGDFAEVVSKTRGGRGGSRISTRRACGRCRSVTPEKLAVDTMIEDLRLLRDQGLAPELNCIRAYPRDEEPEVVATDVYSFHADSAPIVADTWLCTYHGAPSEGLLNEDAQRKVDDPAIRAELLKVFGGEDGEGFREFLHECCYDLHYAPKPGAHVWSFGVGNLWRIATDSPGNPVPPCVHRAPENRPGDPARLLLIS